MKELEDLGPSLLNATMFGPTNGSYPQNMWDPDWKWEVEMQDPPFHNPLAVLINVSMIQPPFITKPLYAVVVPTIILVSCLTNSLVFLVVNQKALRTPTNIVLVTMAGAELATGISSLPWSIYYLWIDVTPDHEMSDFWCRFHQLFALHLPALFHTTSIWLTCFLAIQRFFFVFFPALMLAYNNRTNFKIILALVIWACCSELPKLCMKKLRNFPGRSGKKYCLQVHHDWIEQYMGFNKFTMYGYVYKLVFIHIIPCFILVLFTTLLFVKLKRQDTKRKELLHRADDPDGKRGSKADGVKKNAADDRPAEATASGKVLFVEGLVDGRKDVVIAAEGAEAEEGMDEGLGDEMLMGEQEEERGVDIVIVEVGRAEDSEGIVIVEIDMGEEDLVLVKVREAGVTEEEGVTEEGQGAEEAREKKVEGARRGTAEQGATHLGAPGRSNSTIPNLRKASSTRPPPKLMQTSTKLLFIIVLIHLMVELPVAILLVARFWAGQVNYDLTGTMFATEFTNIFMVVRNFLIIITYPFNFSIYFGMSSNFKKELLAAYCMRLLRRRLRRRRPRPSDSDDWGRRFSMPITKSSESSRRTNAEQSADSPEGSDDGPREVMIAGSRSLLYDASRHSEQLL